MRNYPLIIPVALSYLEHCYYVKTVLIQIIQLNVIEVSSSNEITLWEN